MIPEPTPADDRELERSRARELMSAAKQWHDAELDARAALLRAQSKRAQFYRIAAGFGIPEP